MNLTSKSIFIIFFLFFSTINSKLNDFEETTKIKKSLYSKSITFDNKEKSFVSIEYSKVDRSYYILKMNESYQEKWRKPLGKGENYSISVVVDLNDSSIYISGCFTNIFLGSNNPKESVSIIKLNSVGNFLWVSNLGEGYSHNGNQNLAVGENYVVAIKNSSFEGGSRMHLYKLSSSNGKITDQVNTSEETSYDNYKYSSVLVDLRDNSIYVLEEYDDNYGGKDLFLNKFSTNFERIGRKRYFSLYNKNHSLGIDQQDGSVYVSGHFHSQNMKRVNRVEFSLIKLDSEMNEIWNLPYENDENLRLMTVNQLNREIIYVASSNKEELLVCKLNSEGIVLNKKSLSYLNNASASAVVLNNENGIFISGNILKGHEENNLFFTKVDEE